MIVEAYAKINLFLEITGKRPDGYHQIQTVMQSVSLRDTVSVEPLTGGRIELTMKDSSLPADASNIAYRACKRFREAFGISSGFAIEIRKRIPVEAGLGGGSADAAAVLRACNAIAGFPATDAQLAAVGAGLGADVPFCVYGGTALCAGIGEQVTPLKPLPKISVLILKNDAGISTPEAYAIIDEYNQKSEFFKNNLCKTDVFSNLLAGLDRGDLDTILSGCFNRFEFVANQKLPGLTALIEGLKADGADAAGLCGSGSAVYGLFRSAADAMKTGEKYKKKTAFQSLCHTVSSY